MRLTRISGLPVVLHDSGEVVGRIRDGLFDLDRRRVVYWCVDLRAGPALLVSAARSTLDLAAMRLRMARADLDERVARDEDLDEDTLASGTLPDLLSTAEGASAPPSGLARVWTLFGRAWRPSLSQRKPAKAPASWLWGQEMTGKPFFSTDGELGRICDIDIDPERAGLRQIHVAQGGGVTLHINMDALRHVPEGSSHFVARSAYIRRPAQGAQNAGQPAPRRDRAMRPGA
jgi:sporulation protein YlmC with PRC-barrel domain